MKNRILPFAIITLVALCGCSVAGRPQESITESENSSIVLDPKAKTIHVLVALCDNRYQGIVPVPTNIGNGQDPDHNLYWGCAFGARSFFTKSKDWELIRKYKQNDTILERIVFRNRHNDYYLVADAFDGKYIKQCTQKLLESCAGSYNDTIHADGKILGLGGHARLRAYIGHDGLMDFNLEGNFKSVDQKKRDVIILACYSKRFFAGPLANAGAYPVLWSTGLMSPEAYTLHDALAPYMENKPMAQIRRKAADAYVRYQKCSQKAALNLLVTGY
jgi:hypothetical protein